MPKRDKRRPAAFHSSLILNLRVSLTTHRILATANLLSVARDSCKQSSYGDGVMRVGIISLYHESNTFAPKPTTFDDFKAQRLLVGNAARAGRLGQS